MIFSQMGYGQGNEWLETSRLLHLFPKKVLSSKEYNKKQFNESTLENGVELFFCGSMPKQEEKPQDIVVLDRFGNAYGMQSLMAPKDFPECGCDDLGLNTAPFDLWFEDCSINTGVGFDASGTVGTERRRVVCKVFKKLAESLNFKTNSCSLARKLIHVEVQPSLELNDYHGFPLAPMDDPQTLAYASAYYDFSQKQGIMYGLPWLLINTNESPFDNGIGGTAAHYAGFLRFNFTFENGNGYWLNSTAKDRDDYPDGTKFYYLETVAKHEALHFLDFVSGLGANGNSRFFEWDDEHFDDGHGGYTLFDTHLKIEPNNIPVILNDSPTTSLDWHLHPNLPTDLHTSCLGGPNWFFVNPIGQDAAVFTNSSFIPGSSFSHLDNTCNNANYLMHPGLPPNTQRDITNTEWDILRALGYEMAGESCQSPGGVNDFGPKCGEERYRALYCEESPQILKIYVKDILANDVFSDDPTEPIGIYYFEVINADVGSVTGPFSDAEGEYYEFTSAQVGLATIQYIPFGCGDNLGNLTSIFINVVPVMGCMINCIEVTHTCPSNSDYSFCKPAYDCCNSENDCNANLCPEIDPLSECNELESPCNIICNPMMEWLVFSDLDQASFCSQDGYQEFINGLDQSPLLEVELFGWEITQGSVDCNANFSGTSPSTRIELAAQSSISTDNHYTDGIITQFPSLDIGRYFLAFETGEGDIFSFLPHNHPSNATLNLAISVIDRADLVLPTFYQGTPAINTGVELAVFGDEVNGYGLNIPDIEEMRVGSCFEILENNDYNSLWIRTTGLSENLTQATCFIDNVELLPDNFTAGKNPEEVDCGEEIRLGTDFCMLSDVKIQYEWILLDENANEVTVVGSYQVENGQLTNASDNIDVNSFEIILYPSESATYRLKRSIVNLSDFPQGFDLCVWQDEVYVSVNALLPTANFQASVDCSTLEVSFIPQTNNSNIIHSWTFGVNSDGSNISNPTYTYPSIGVYEVVHTLTNQCGIVSQTQNITVDNCCSSPVISIQGEATGSCGEYTFTATGENIDTYSWDFGGGNISTDNPATFIFTENGSYTVIFTAYNECGESVSQTVEVEVMCHIVPLACGCTGENTINIQAGTGTSIWDTDLVNNANFYQIWTNSYFFFNSCLAIQGNLILDQGMQLSIFNGEIKMQPGASITVKKGAALSLRDVNDDMDGDGKAGVNGCEIMWKGIFLEEGTGITDVGGEIPFMQNTVIQDAQYAITAMPNSKIGYLVNNIFTRNHVGIYAPLMGTGIENKPIFTGTMTNNTFTADGLELLPLFDESILPFYDTKYPYAGIFINNASFSLGFDAPTTPRNNFSNMRNGIVGNMTDMMIFGANIENIQQGGSSDFFYNNIESVEGNGIFIIKSTGILNQNSFTNTNRGILSRETISLTTNYNEMTEVHSGILDILGSNNSFTALNNIISFDKTGIFSYYGGTTDIGFNTLLALSDPYLNYGRGIEVMKDPFFSLIQNRVFSNNFTLISKYIGISLIDSDWAVIENNQIEYQNGVNILSGVLGYGVLLLRSHNSLIKDNSAFSNTILDWTVGFLLENSFSSRLCCNSSNNFVSGFEFIGACNNTQLRYSDIGSHDYGLVVDGVIGQQGSEDDPVHFGNQWTGTYSKFGAVNYDEVEDGDDYNKLLEESGFLIEPPTTSILWPPTWANGQMLDKHDEWFHSASGYSPSCSDDTQNCNDEIIFVSNIRQSDIKAAKAEYRGQYADMYNWESQRYLYEQLIQNPQLTGLNLDVDAFKSAANNGPIGGLYDIGTQSSHLFALTTQQEAQLKNDRQQVQNTLQALILLDSLLVIATTATDSLSIEIQRGQQLENLQVRWNDIRSMKELIRQNRLNQVDAVLAENETIVATSSLSNNQKIVNNVFLNTIGKDVFMLDSVQFELIRTIAEQCPFEGGNAVYRARALYQLNEVRSFELEDFCNKKSKKMETPGNGKHNYHTPASNIRLYPNPGKNQLNIELPEWSNGKQLSMDIYNLDGKRVYQLQTTDDGSTLKVDISKWTNGVYYCRIQINEGIISTLKVVVLH